MAFYAMKEVVLTHGATIRGNVNGVVAHLNPRNVTNYSVKIHVTVLTMAYQTIRTIRIIQTIRTRLYLYICAPLEEGRSTV
jgi:hypothetical protein